MKVDQSVDDDSFNRRKLNLDFDIQFLKNWLKTSQVINSRRQIAEPGCLITSKRTVQCLS